METPSLWILEEVARPIVQEQSSTSQAVHPLPLHPNQVQPAKHLPEGGEVVYVPEDAEHLITITTVAATGSPRERPDRSFGHGEVLQRDQVEKHNLRPVGHGEVDQLRRPPVAPQEENLPLGNDHLVVDEVDIHRKTAPHSVALTAVVE